LIKTFIITGTTTGLGESLVDYLINETPHNVIAISRKITERQLQYDKARFTIILFDLNRIELFSEIFSQLDNLIQTNNIVFISNAATIDPINSIGCFLEEDLKASIHVNFFAPILIVNHLAKIVKEKNVSFINISSGAAHRPIPGWGMYCATKSATNMFFDVLTVENPDIVVKNIDPGVLDTPMQNKLRERQFKGVEEFIRFKTSGLLKNPNEVAAQIVKELI
jgi:benzil reductase ((S)-benzoin forming)